MDGSTIKQMFINIIDDEDLTETFMYQLMNQAKDGVERLRQWMMLRVKNSENSTTKDNTYTDAISLPDNFRSMRKLMVGDVKLTPIPFERQIEYKDSSGYYFVDVANNNLYLCGTVQESKTIHIFYTKTTDDIGSSNEPEWPDDFHKLIPYEMAFIFNGTVDADNISYRMTKDQRIERQRILEGMEDWDDELQLSEIDHSTSLTKEAIGDGRIPPSYL